MTDASPAVLVEVEDSVGWITLNRPDAANAFDLPTGLAFAEAVDRCAEDDVRVIAIVAAGKRFCAGGDVKSFLASEDPPAYLQELASTLELALRKLSELPKPVIAAVHGAVAGAGLAFPLVADVVVAARSTRFTMAYSSIGLTPDAGVSYLLPRFVGPRRAFELALLGRVLSAEEASDWGLVTEVVDDAAIRERIEELAAVLAAGPASALGQARRLIRSSYEATRQASAEDEAATIAAAVGTQEARRLIGKFIDR